MHAMSVHLYMCIYTCACVCIYILPEMYWSKHPPGVCIGRSPNKWKYLT